MKKLLVATIAASLVISFGTTSAQAAGVKTSVVSVCVDKKTNSLSLAKKGKCATSKVRLELSGKIPTPKNGNTVLSGLVDPDASTGEIGDFFLNSAAYKLFGPKTASGWGVGKSLVGPTGPKGDAGSNGAAGATGATGAAGTDSQLVALNKLPSGFNQLAKIQTALVGCCELANNNLAISFELYNLSNSQSIAAGHTLADSTDLWINYFDAQGTRLSDPSNQATFFLPTSWSYTSSGNWDGTTWTTGTAKGFKLLINGVHANKPNNAVYYSITWRPWGSWTGDWGINGNATFAGNKLLMTQFHATGF